MNDGTIYNVKLWHKNLLFLFVSRIETTHTTHTIDIDNNRIQLRQKKVSSNKKKTKFLVKEQEHNKKSETL